MNNFVTFNPDDGGYQGIAPIMEQDAFPQIAPDGNEAHPTIGTADGAVYAEPETTSGFFNPTLIILWGLIIVGMWFMLIRPQRKREKQVREMQASLKVGENVITTSGFYGKIVGSGDDAFLVEFGENRGLRVWVRKTDIAGAKAPVTTMSKGDVPFVDDKKEDKKEDKKKDKDK
ncbi:MAG: preprotein translocase subunit YajC [Defluviitaleaceae bacterium]|nr:preprotein translocase subunit YajC [Defluviitaleaceae bacterium]